MNKGQRMACPSDEPPSTEAPAPAAVDQQAPSREPLSSAHLLQGRRAIEISHNGTVYRLQATKLGKLILTK